MSLRQEKINTLLKKLASEFFARVSTGVSLITVTDAKVARNLHRATIFITIFPDKMEADGLAFANRKRSELRDYICENTDLRTLPFLDIHIDEGERNRQHIDTLMNSDQTKQD